MTRFKNAKNLTSGFRMYEQFCMLSSLIKQKIYVLRMIFSHSGSSKSFYGGKMIQLFHQLHSVVLFQDLFPCI